MLNMAQETQKSNISYGMKYVVLRNSIDNSAAEMNLVNNAFGIGNQDHWLIYTQ